MALFLAFDLQLALSKAQAPETSLDQYNIYIYIKYETGEGTPCNAIFIKYCTNRKR